MSKLHFVIASSACLSICAQANALFSVNVLQDNTTVPGWVINTFTVDSDTDMLGTVALSDLASGSILNLPGPIPLETFSNGPGDSFVTVNGNPNTIIAGGAGDLDPSAPATAILSDSLINLTWSSISFDDIGLGLHLATFTFSDDAFGSLAMISTSDEVRWTGDFSIDQGVVELVDFSFILHPVDDDPPPPTPDPDPTDPPDTGGTDPGSTDPPTGGDPFPTGNTIPEPAGLGLLAVAAAFIGGLHRRRLGAGG